MNPHITKALACLQKANYAGYFEEMNKVVPAPSPFKIKLTELRMQFVSGETTFKFPQQLTDFANLVDDELAEQIASEIKKTDTISPNNMQTQRQSIAVLFADMKGFSGIKSDKIKAQAYLFIHNLVQKVKENDLFVLNSQNTHLVGNTWGDAIFLADTSATNLAKIALKIRDEARQTDWEYELNLSEPIKFRIGLNFGEAEVIIENGKIVNVVGGTVDLGARIEPATEVDAVFCSDIFWQLIQGKANIKALSRTITLPKNAGEMKAHKLLWEWEQSEVADAYDKGKIENVSNSASQNAPKPNNEALKEELLAILAEKAHLGIPDILEKIDKTLAYEQYDRTKWVEINSYNNPMTLAVMGTALVVSTKSLINSIK